MGAELNSTPRAATRFRSRPLIGISASEVRNAETIRQIREDEPPGREAVLATDYIAAIEVAGGVPVIVPPLGPDSLDALLRERIDGLCLSGGPDLDPAAYDAEPDANLGPTDREFDEFELAISKRAVAMDIPLLAICRGMQVLNASCGGTLIQHLPDRSSMSHRQEEPGHLSAHSVRAVPGSRLATLAGRTDLRVNTFHHQAIDVPGTGLKVTGQAPDGVIEAIEGCRPGFLLGVQWHAELMAIQPTEARIFAGLVAAADAHSERRSESALR